MPEDKEHPKSATPEPLPPVPRERPVELPEDKDTENKRGGQGGNRHR